MDHAKYKKACDTLEDRVKMPFSILLLDKVTADWKAIIFWKDWIKKFIEENAFPHCASVNCPIEAAILEYQSGWVPQENTLSLDSN